MRLGGAGIGDCDGVGIRLGVVGLGVAWGWVVLEAAGGGCWGELCEAGLGHYVGRGWVVRVASAPDGGDVEGGVAVGEGCCQGFGGVALGSVGGVDRVAEAPVACWVIAFA